METRGSRRNKRKSIEKEPGIKQDKVEKIPQKKKKESEPDIVSANSIYDFKVKNIKGEEVSLEEYKGYVCIIVNVASRCGHTKAHYEQLVKLHDTYAEAKGLRILAFPCNQFGSQEPGSNETICQFAAKKNVQFDMFDKCAVKGKNALGLFKFLTEQIAGPKGKDIAWNFTKFVINKEGKVVKRFEPKTKPLEMEKDLQELF